MLSKLNTPSGRGAFARTVVLLVSLHLLSALLVGCDRKSVQNPSTHQWPHPIFSDDDLKRLIVPGMDEADVKMKVGSPDGIETDQNNVEWTYLFPDTSKKVGFSLGGFSVNFVNGKVEKWSPIMLQTLPTFTPSGGQTIATEQSFKLLVANDALTNIANTIDLEGTVDVSSLKMSPELEFKAKVFVGDNQKERSNLKTIFLNIRAEDVSKLKNLTENNLGKRLIIIYRNQAFAAPLVSVPLDSPQIMFDVKNSVVSKIKIN